MIAEWKESDDVYELGQLLVKHGVFDAALWRLFHCRCYRNVWEFLTEESKSAVVQAERVASNEVPVTELADVHQAMIQDANVAWSHVNALKIPSDNDDAVWPLSDDVDNAWCSYLSAECAKTATTSEIEVFVIPESASSLIAWATARKDVLGKHRTEERGLVEIRWKEIRDEEEQKQASILRELVTLPRTSDVA